MAPASINLMMHGKIVDENAVLWILKPKEKAERSRTVFDPFAP